MHYADQVRTIGKIHYQCDHPISIQVSPVVAMLQRLGGVTVEQPNMFDNNKYTIQSAKFVSPVVNHAYASVSGDYNPIHTSSLFAELAGLPDTITHGMWTSALTRKYVELYAAENQPQRVVAYQVEFVDMCLPNMELETTLRHVGMQNGRKIIEVTTSSVQDQRVILRGTAQVEQARTCYVFTGQGSQEVGMGMELYNQSPVAKSIWDRADHHFKTCYGFSILEIVRTNCKSITVHFGGKRGRKIREYYKSMKIDVVDKDGKITTKSLFPTITEDTDSYTFSAPEGLLFATQFAQPALTLVEKAAFADMQSRGLVQSSCPFAGHSLGEYAALAAVADLLPVESLVDIVFYRGMTMQNAVPRDEHGKSNYSMCAVNPARVHPQFKERDLEELVAYLANETGCLLEIVNYNVESWQYVIAGDNQGLVALTEVLNAMSKGIFEKEKLEEIMRDKDIKKIPLERGHASIPLSGIDVPFHSSFLLPGVVPFRNYIMQKVSQSNVFLQKLENSYIPNLVARPFQVTLEYVDYVFEKTQSPILMELKREFPLSSVESKQKAARILLIELLAYQFASAVQWIQTQAVLFEDYKVERFIEVGPSATLTNMAERTLKLKYTAYDDARTFRRKNLSYARNKQQIYYEYNDDAASIPTISSSLRKEGTITVSPDTSTSTSTSTHSKPPNTENSSNSSPNPTVTGEAEIIPDTVIPSWLLLACLLSQKLKVPVEKLDLNKTIKDLSGGKSTMQNEIIGDLQKEIGTIPEQAEDVSVKELSTQLQIKGLGKHTSALVSKLVSSKMPGGGFNLTQIKEHLRTKYGLDLLRADAFLLLGCTMEPTNRFTTQEQAKAWLQEVAETYARLVKIEYRQKQGGKGQDAENSVSLSAGQLKILFASQRQLWTKQMQALATALQMDLNAPLQQLAHQQTLLDQLQEQLDLWLSEHGEKYAQGIRPFFNPLKARRFDSAWNWVRQDALNLFFEIIFGRLKDVDRALIAQCLHVMNRADQHVVHFMKYWLEHHHPFFVKVQPENYALVQSLGMELVGNCCEAINMNPVYKYVEYPTAPETKINEKGRLEYNEVLRPGVRKIAAYVEMMQKDQYLSVKVLDDSTQTWKLSEDLTQRYFKVLSHVTDEGLTLSNKSILMTGCGRDSIGSAILKGALSAGAKIVVTTSRFTQQITEYYRGIFERHGSRGSVLIVVPFNQGSSTDTQQLIQYIYKELEWDLDFVVPFAAISENGRELSDIDSVSELAHRIMLTNLIRLLGFVISEKKKRGIITRPAQVILPLSPNHGVFGGDGLYGESKIALECMLNRWSSESWGEYLCLVGAVIGWTRGTGLMQSNNLVAQGVEELGVYTFSQAEMAFNLLSLMHPMIVRLSQEQPLYVDLAGRMNKLPKLNEKVTELRMTLLGNSEIQQVVLQDHKYDQNAVVNPKFEPKVIPRANLRFDFPELPAFEDLHKQLGVLQGMIDLEKVVVVTGYGEVGPYGNSRTRWDMESKGQFSLEGCIEMAWMMGFIRHYQGTLEDGTKYAGWVDTETGKPVRDTEIKSKYEDRILKHTGIRLIEPELFDGYRPEHKTLLQEIIVEEDMSPIEMSKEEAIQFAKEHGNLCVLKELESGQYSVLLKKGARLYIPKALRFDRLVAGQVPKGWSARRYGIPNDIIRQVDRLTLYVLVSTVEALINSGITDPYEFYKYVHVTDVGSTSGSGVGGAQSNRKVYRDRFLDKQVQQDILQETFINTIAAWINLLLLSSSGPIKTPVGACATAVQSVELGVEAILGGKAKIVLVGGYDDFTEEGSFEFANMKATSNSDAEMAMGREPKEMCRPAASTRSGFMESHGAGMEILMNASIAIEMGVPIYGIVALTNTATDKVGRSVPAPGKGVLTTARQIPQRFPSKLLDLQYRRQQCQRQLRHISEWMEEETKQILEEAATQVDAEMREIFVRERKEAMERDAKRQTKAVLSTWSNDFYSQDPSIAPLRGALGVWGLTIDDIGLASFHGTGTKANDFNESQVLNEQFNHLGRSQGNPVPCVFQKYLTGHPKGAAASWMLNGMLQSLQTGIVPGNRNADNIDAAMQQFTNLLYPSVSITTDGIKAGLLKSFGFGQVGGEVLVIHPHFVLAVLKEHEYKAYVQRRSARQDKCYRYWHDTLTGSIDFVSVKNAPPYTKEQEVQVYLDPSMRASWDSTSRSYQFSSSTITPSLPLPTTWVTAMNVSPQTLESTEKQQKGIGIDIEHISVFNDLTSSLIERNFTKREIEYCLSRPDPSSSFAGKWAAKESVVKAISNFDLNRPKVWVQGAGAPLIDIEILISTSGAPQVFVHNLAAKACEDVGVNEVKTSISHSGEYAMALSQAF
ncbi:3-oxoacyl-[acyl-carrier-protein] synthase [Coelomomyces lativittatus]|nr:3-oxoacyl-[acyl-carrier-protein] synthase [Coelomomyces lativittatus]